jgi:ComF family protein
VSDLASRFVSALVDLAGDALAPRRCASCDEPVERAAFCAPCAATVERARAAPPPTAGAPTLAAFEYGGAISRALMRAKYKDHPELLRVLARCALDPLAGALEEIARGAVLVPVPLHATKLAERGYNQSARIAATLARAVGASHVPRALERRFDTRSQAQLPRRERLRNVTGAFVARAPLCGARVVLVDDVTTTGATLRACADALGAAGAVLTGCVVVAFAERGGL